MAVTWSPSAAGMTSRRRYARVRCQRAPRRADAPDASFAGFRWADEYRGRAEL